MCLRTEASGNGIDDPRGSVLKYQTRRSGEISGGCGSHRGPGAHDSVDIGVAKSEADVRRRLLSAVGERQRVEGEFESQSGRLLLDADERGRIMMGNVSDKARMFCETEIDLGISN